MNNSDNSKANLVKPTKIIFKGWVEVPRPESSTIDMWKGEGATNINFIHDWAENGKIKYMRSVIQTSPWVIDTRSMNRAMQNALKVGQIKSIAFLMQYVDIIKPEFLKTFLQINAKLPYGNEMRVEAMEFLRVNSPGFLEQVYTMGERLDEKTYQYMTEYLIFKAKNDLSQAIPKIEDKEGVIFRV